MKLIVSFGGEIRRCPVSGSLRYVGGENLLVKVGLSERLAGLRARLAARARYPDVRIRYAIVEEGMDKLHDVENDGDLWRLLTLLYYRAAGVAVSDYCCRVRAFLSPVGGAAPPPPPAPCMRQSASSPALRHAISELDTGSMTTSSTASSQRSSTCAKANNMGASLQRAQSVGSALHVASPNPSRADSELKAHATIAAEQHNATKIDEAIRRAYSGFEVEAMAAAAAEQKEVSSTTKVDEATHLTREGSRLEALATIAAERRNTTKVDEAIRRAVSEFEAMAVAAAEQKKLSSATKVDEATTLTRADSELEAFTAEQKNPSSPAKLSSRGSTGASQASSGAEAVAHQNMLMPCPAPVILVPVVPPPVVAVFYYYPVIPVYGCIVLNGSHQSVGTRA